jgi:hypothetical protein
LTTASTSPEIRLLQRFTRCWPVAVLGLLATILLSVAVLALVPARYTAKADLLLTPPPTNPTATSTGNPNPYIQLGGLQPLADVVSRNMMSSGVRATLHAKGVTSSYAVVRDTTTDGPLLTLSTSGTSAAAALKDLSTIIAAAGPQLSRLQAAESVPISNRVTIAAVAKDTAAATSRKSQIRATLVAVVAGLLGTALAVSVVDTILIRRRARRMRRPGATVAAAHPAFAASGDGRSGQGLARSRAFLRPLARRRVPVPQPPGSSDRAADVPAEPTFAEPDAAARHRPLPGLEPVDGATTPIRSGRRIRSRVTPPASGIAEPPDANGPDAEAAGRGSDSRVGTHSP